jgi:hypothetical protein
MEEVAFLGQEEEHVTREKLCFLGVIGWQAIINRWLYANKEAKFPAKEQQEYAVVEITPERIIFSGLFFSSCDS